MAPPGVSVVLPASSEAPLLEAALESYAAQTLRDFELVLIGDRDETARAAERFGARLSLVYLRRPAASRAEARNAGVAASSGALVWLADDQHVATPDCLQELADDYARGAALIVGAQTPGDCCFDRVAPLVARFGARLDGLQLPWLAALGGQYALSRSALAECQGFDARFAGWDAEDLDLPFRWWSSGQPIRVTRRAVCARQDPQPDAQPLVLADQVEAFARKHGALDAWLLWRFLRGDEPDAIHAVALERARGPSAPGRELARLAEELVRSSVSATRSWWRP